MAMPAKEALRIVRKYQGPTISRNGTEQIGTLFHGTERNR